jgi:hypothetical protein
MKKKILLFSLVCLLQQYSFSQCISMPIAPSCIGTVLTDGIYANSGTTYIYSGGTSTLTVHFGGADVIVCSGNLTLSNSSGFNGGKLYILGGATVNTNQTVLNTIIYNYGTLNINSNLTVNSAGLLMNATTGHLNINGDLYENTIITNYGIIAITGKLTIANAGSGACLGIDSKLNTNTIEYDWNSNPIKVNNGEACIGVSASNVIGNTSLTSSSNVKICASGTLGVNGVGTLGSAVLTQNCSSCAVALPIELLYFNVNVDKTSILLNWKTLSEKNNDFFSILKSYNGIDFNNLEDIKGCGTCTYSNTYKYVDYSPQEGINYYYLKQTDNDGKTSSSDIKSILFNNFDFLISFPNSKEFKITFNNKKEKNVSIEVFDVLGKSVLKEGLGVEQGTEFCSSDYHMFSNGVYFIVISCNNILYTKEVIIK